ncbi:MAG TPA: hypothetical protein VFO96_05710 [Gemmatimonadales bacterium]|jgi:hypothetical protein|nr:hypothetical protein [Gemmatimonadales bacterium]
MPRTCISRLSALILSLLIMGGGSGLPVVDAALHHLHGSMHVQGAHLSDPGDSAHAERCTLGAPLPTLARSADVHAAELTTLQPRAMPARPEPADSAGVAPSSQLHARAPPLSLA